MFVERRLFNILDLGIFLICSNSRESDDPNHKKAEVAVPTTFTVVNTVSVQLARDFIDPSHWMMAQHTGLRVYLAPALPAYKMRRNTKIISRIVAPNFPGLLKYQSIRYPMDERDDIRAI